MEKITIYDALTRPNELEKKEISEFLFTNLEQYGDKIEDILKCMEYATKEIASFGGYIFVYEEQNKKLGVVVINQTGMKGYIPENILVYIATAKESRGKGVGKKLMEVVLNYVKGDIALHVEANNPAKFLYEKYGFTNPYLEMRLKR